MTDELQQIVDGLRALGKANLGARVAARATEPMRRAVSAHLAAGEPPEGKAWEKTKKGGRAYAHAANKLTAVASGNLLRLTVTGPEVYGHFGARGMPVRQMLPDAGAGIPKEVGEVIGKALGEELGKVFK